MTEYYCEACGRKHNGKYSSHYCRKHSWQLKQYGKLLDTNPRTKFDPNEFRFKDGHVEFDTYKVPTLDVDQTYLIDAEDYPRVSKHKWRSINKYAVATINGKAVALQRFLLDAKPGQTVDHININVLDNRKSNLRYATHALQSLNRKGYNKYGIKGIEEHLYKNGGSPRYSAYFRNNSKQYHSPCYNTVEEAIFARFILEQMFCQDYLYQEHSLPELAEDVKRAIIHGIKVKFNR